MTAADAGLVRFHALAADTAEEALRACCAAPAWIASMLAGRPYASRAAMIDEARRSLAALDWAGVRTALDAHPRIGERAAGGGREASWSRSEQSGMDGSPAQVRAALVAANQVYEEQFGHVFLIFATGRTDTEMLDAARTRLGNDEATERDVVREELRKIVELRVAKLLDGLASDELGGDELGGDEPVGDEPGGAP